MDPAELPEHVAAWRRSRSWFKLEAAKAHDEGRFRLITGRADTDLYLARFWVSPMRAGDESGAESADSVLLHWFLRGDDDRCLHDHPWDFTTTLLRGRYVEHLPPVGWNFATNGGPPWDLHVIERWEGDTVEHRAEDLHCVGKVEPDTWTLVRTKARRRAWGFHPLAQRWMPYREYLDAKRAEAPLAAAG